MDRRLAVLVVLLAGTPVLRAAEETPRFSRHVEAVFSRLGCNGGTCHGAVKGQNGFRLTLFAADPALDHERLRREFAGRRLDVADPPRSLLLRKATGQVMHAGGKRTEVGSFEYEILRRWIAGGAVLDPVDSSRVVQIRALPAEQTLRPGQSVRLRVEAQFADGTTEDVTRLCSFQTRDKQVAVVDDAGEVRATGPGDTAILLRYRGEPVMARVLVPRPGSTPFPLVTPHNFIDRHILAKLQRLNLPPAGLADDTTFLRRASLDVTGELPAAKEVRAFLADKDPAKRARKIDELLARPGHAALWTLKFCDLLKASDFGVYADALSQEADAPRFQHWVRARLEENIPYDEFAARILTATSREGRSLDAWAKEVRGLFEGYTTPRTDLALYAKRRTLDLYWQRRHSVGVPGALQVAHTFLGLRLECAQCHRHPHDVWQQEDLLRFANFFMRVRPAGFQGENEKRFPEVAVYFKKLNADAKKLTDEVKKLRETRGKKLEAEARKTKDPAVRAEYAKYQKEFAALDRRSKMLPEVARRLMHAEAQHLPAAKTAFATVTSPLGTQSAKTFRLLGATEDVALEPGQDPREQVAAWLRRPDNPYFARALVNRVWAHYFGRGIVDPPDNLSPFNPATHPELLAELAREFVRHRYDLRWLHRTILTSRTYQQSSVAPPESRTDRANYAYFYHRRLPAEVFLDALDHATGTREDMDMKYYHWPERLRTVEVPFTPRNGFVAFMLEHFGRPRRNAAAQCDCERDTSASVLQVLSLANHPHVWKKVTDPKGRVARLLAEVADERGRVEALFLAALARLPDEAERKACARYLQGAPSPQQGYQGILWGLLNTREFLLQH